MNEKMQDTSMKKQWEKPQLVRVSDAIRSGSFANLYETQTVTMGMTILGMGTIPVS